jgi:Mor family transcriptional regulator
MRQSSEVFHRNQLIYQDWKNGMRQVDIAKKYYLTHCWVSLILKEQRRKAWIERRCREILAEWGAAPTRA